MGTIHEDFKSNVEQTEEKKSKNTLTYVLVVLVVGLLLFSAVQTFQIGKMEKAVLSGALTGNPGAAAAGASSPRAAASSAAMVGGC